MFNYRQKEKKQRPCVTVCLRDLGPTRKLEVFRSPLVALHYGPLQLLNKLYSSITLPNYLLVQAGFSEKARKAPSPSVAAWRCYCIWCCWCKCVHVAVIGCTFDAACSLERLCLCKGPWEFLKFPQTGPWAGQQARPLQADAQLYKGRAGKCFEFTYHGGASMPF